jgi:hypothetical protein
MPQSMSYDHPQYVAHQLTPIRLPATAASTAILKFPAHVDMKVKRISAVIAVAGTNASAGYDVFNGTTSVGTIITGTAAAGTFNAGLTQDIVVSSGSFLEFRTKANSATLVADVAVEFVPVAGADVT